MNNEKTVPCRCCGSDTAKYLWSGALIELTVKYFECSQCGYVQTEQPHWLPRAYTDAINASDTGIMARNYANVSKIIVTLKLLGVISGRVLDWAGGIGILVRLLRDAGIDALWADGYSDNLLARGFEHKDEKVELVTAFEVFEHFSCPAEELDRLLGFGRNLLLSTMFIPDPAPDHTQWWYYGREHGQHVGFFRAETLRKLAHSRGLHFISNGTNLHLMSEQRVNEKYWRILMKFSGIAAPLVSRHLKSRTWPDHVLLAKSNDT